MAWDRLVTPTGAPPPLASEAVAGLARAGIQTIVLHKTELGTPRLDALHEQLVRQGATPVANDGSRWLLSVPPR